VHDAVRRAWYAARVSICEYSLVVDYAVSDEQTNGCTYDGKPVYRARSFREVGHGGSRFYGIFLGSI